MMKQQECLNHIQIISAHLDLLEEKVTELTEIDMTHQIIMLRNDYKTLYDRHAAAQATIDMLHKTCEDKDIEIKRQQQHRLETYNKLTDTVELYNGLNQTVEELKDELATERNLLNIYRNENNNFIELIAERDRYKNTVGAIASNRDRWRDKYEAMYSAVIKVYEED